MSSRWNHNKGARCEYARGGRNPISTQKRSEHVGGGHCYHVPIPKNIRGGVVAGKQGCNFRCIEKDLLPHIVHLSLLQTDSVTVVGCLIGHLNQ